MQPIRALVVYKNLFNFVYIDRLKKFFMQLWFTPKLGGRYRDLPYAPCPHVDTGAPTASPPGHLQ